MGIHQVAEQCTRQGRAPGPSSPRHTDGTWATPGTFGLTTIPGNRTGTLASRTGE
ncbi:hypothetical protein ACFRMQ_01015 [Kitasatospora sp. NPDC056783]|uniref:hypothetical protein n=1 Tax=Kitasatospora sp. NPDC056783 TaxID=3345943 RepID=UPI00368A7B98